MNPDLIHIQRIRQGDQQAWFELIQLYEGRLLAYCRIKVNSKSHAEDLVQETFMGFLMSLPNYQETTPVESFLFSIANYKIIDHLRKTGRRKTDLLSEITDSSAMYEHFISSERGASSLIRSQERKSGEAELIQRVLSQLISQWKEQEDYQRLKCVELLFACGVSNKEAANELQMTEQEVANHKQFVMQKLKEAVRASGLESSIVKI